MTDIKSPICMICGDRAHPCYIIGLSDHSRSMHICRDCMRDDNHLAFDLLEIQRLELHPRYKTWKERMEKSDQSAK